MCNYIMEHFMIYGNLKTSGYIVSQFSASIVYDLNFNFFMKLNVLWWFQLLKIMLSKWRSSYLRDVL